MFNQQRGATGVESTEGALWMEIARGTVAGVLVVELLIVLEQSTDLRSIIEPSVNSG